jgi:hypothetical protein
VNVLRWNKRFRWVYSPWFAYKQFLCRTFGECKPRPIPQPKWTIAWPSGLSTVRIIRPRLPSSGWVSKMPVPTC